MTDLDPAKIPFLGEIAYFATDRGTMILRNWRDDASAVQADASALVEAAGRSRSGPELAQAWRTLPADVRSRIAELVNRTYFAAHPLTNSLYVFETTMGPGWTERFGLGDAEEAVALIGPELYTRLNDLARYCNDLFLAFDGLADKMADRPLSQRDLMLTVAYGMLDQGASIDSYMTDYCVGEGFRTEIRKINFPPDAIKVINERFNARYQAEQPVTRRAVDLRQVLR